jgi:chromosome segregation ATPase
VLFVIFVGYAVAKEFRILEKPAEKSERELLSADQLTFRKSLMEQVRTLNGDVKSLREEHADCEKRSSDCEERYEALAAKFSFVIAEIKAGGLDILMKLGQIDAIPNAKSDPQRLTVGKKLWP